MKKPPFIGRAQGLGQANSVIAGMKNAAVTGLVASAIVLSGCSGKTIEPMAPVWVGKGTNDLQGTICGTCGGLESKEDHKLRQKRKKESAKNGTLNTDIVEDYR